VARFDAGHLLIISAKRFLRYSSHHLYIGGSNFLQNILPLVIPQHSTIEYPIRLSTRRSAAAEIARDADDAIQSYPRSSIVVPIDAAYMTSY